MISPLVRVRVKKQILNIIIFSMKSEALNGFSGGEDFQGKWAW
jgi:hypothetical protein